MKRLDELGVSPAPWQAVWHRAKALAWVDSFATEDGVADMCAKGRERCNADARLIAAAPDLYEALCDAVRYRCEYLCEEWKRRDGGYCDGCIVTQEWKKALEKAGGKE